MIAAAVEAAAALVRSDGADLVLVAADPAGAGSSCACRRRRECATGACVLPGEYLEPLIAAALRAICPGEFELRLHDPRA